jgi:hypothetical protein
VQVDALNPEGPQSELRCSRARMDVFCPGCGTNRTIDLRALDRHPLASVGTLVLGLRCSWCPGSARMPKLLGLYALPPPAGATARPICFR